MSDGITVRAGECTTTFDGNRVRGHEQRGRMVAVVKPDNTILVHDADGYQPVAWLTRAESVRIDEETLVARDGDQTLCVEIHETFGEGRYPASTAGKPVGTCPDCAGALVRASGDIACTECGRRHGIPGDATVLDENCGCGLPRMAVERGERFELCVDRACESLDTAVRDAFDREWACPECDGDLRILRRGGLLAGCEHYPDCDVGFAMPCGVVTGTCDCRLPVFETQSGQRCLDSSCDGAARERAVEP